MANSGPSLNSVANLLSSSRLRQQLQRPTQSVTLKQSNPADKIRPGRHRCDCQARIHGLVRNCSSCGRVVCEQEGSGPCFFCGQLVCTTEQREILNRNSKKSVQLYNQLMDAESGNSRDYFTLSSVGKALLKAEDYKMKLLQADADTERKTRVNDLESDYDNMENNIYLTKEERDAIIARKEELKKLRAQQKRMLIVNFDFENGTVTQVHKDCENSKDPVIMSILELSRKKRPSNANTVPHHFSQEFVPKYDPKLGRTSHNIDRAKDDDDIDEESLAVLNDDVLYREVARKGFAVGLPQPFASLLVYGIIKHIAWDEYIDIRGPIFIASKGKAPSEGEVQQLELFRKRLISKSGPEKPLPKEFPTGAVVGRALLVNCLPSVDYYDEYPNGDCFVKHDAFALIFDVFEPLLVPVPHLPPSSGVYRIDKQLNTIISDILNPL